MHTPTPIEEVLIVYDTPLEATTLKSVHHIMQCVNSWQHLPQIVMCVKRSATPDSPPSTIQHSTLLVTRRQLVLITWLF